MSEMLPAPLVSSEVDVRNLDGFMLNVERLMASELVALSSHEVIAAALFLWCRAWKQLPAASLPDDDRVIAAFARLPMAKYRRLKPDVLRGFKKCSDGRLYHGVLAEEAIRAFGRKSAHENRREKDAERLRQWRLKQAGNADETIGEARFDTSNETRFVAEGTGRDGTGRKEEERESRERATSPPDPLEGSKPTSKRGRLSKNLKPWPPDFALTPELQAYATKHGFDGDWLFEKFHNKALAKGWEYRDWVAAFRNFAQSEQSYTPHRANGSQPNAAPDV